MFESIKVGDLPSWYEGGLFFMKVRGLDPTKGLLLNILIIISTYEYSFAYFTFCILMVENPMQFIDVYILIIISHDYIFTCVPHHTTMRCISFSLRTTPTPSLRIVVSLLAAAASSLHQPDQKSEERQHIINSHEYPRHKFTLEGALGGALR